MVSATKFYRVLEISSCARRCPKYVINITLLELRLVCLVIVKHLPLNRANFRSHGYAPNQSKCKNNLGYYINSSRVLDIAYGTFTPLMFTKTGGMGNECLNYHSRLAELIAKEKTTPKQFPRNEQEHLCISEINTNLSQRNYILCKEITGLSQH